MYIISRSESGIHDFFCVFTPHFFLSLFSPKSALSIISKRRQKRLPTNNIRNIFAWRCLFVYPLCVLMLLLLLLFPCVRERTQKIVVTLNIEKWTYLHLLSPSSYPQYIPSFIPLLCVAVVAVMGVNY